MSSNFFTSLPKQIQYLSVFIVVAVFLLGAYLFGVNGYYQVRLLPDVSVVATTTIKTTVDPEAQARFLATAKVAKLFIGCDDAHLQMYAARPLVQNAMYTRDSAAYPQLCAELKKTSAPALALSLLTSTGGNNGYAGVGTLSMAGKVYLVSFALYQGDKNDYTFSVNDWIELHDVKTLEAMTTVMNDNSLLHIRGLNAEGQIFERYIAFQQPYLYGVFKNPATKLSDGSFIQNVSSLSVPNTKDVSFSLPVSFDTTRATARDFLLEQTSNQAPIYFAPSCGHEPTYADFQLSLSPYFAGLSGLVTVSVHNYSAPALSITSAMTGYAPEEWGKILKTLTPAEFANRIHSKVIEGPGPVEHITVGGLEVKHIGPHSPPSGCQYREGIVSSEYQMEKNGAVITILFDRYPSYPDRSTPQLFPKEKELELVTQIASTLVVTPYLP